MLADAEPAWLLAWRERQSQPQLANTQLQNLIFMVTVRSSKGGIDGSGTVCGSLPSRA